MGPRSFDHGNAAVVPVPASWYLLQWGRDHLITEIFTLNGHNAIRNWLQWGRNH